MPIDGIELFIGGNLSEGNLKDEFVVNPMDFLLGLGRCGVGGDDSRNAGLGPVRSEQMRAGSVLVTVSLFFGSTRARRTVTATLG